MIDFKTAPFKWLEQEPLPEDLMQNPDGTFYQPIEIIKAKLDVLCPSSWETKNFNHNFIMAPFGGFYCSGSVELIIKPKFPKYIAKIDYSLANEKTVEELLDIFEQQPLQFLTPVCKEINEARTLVGAATFTTEKYFNPPKENNHHFAAICLSLAIVNAAQNISPFFGKNLNKAIQIDKEIQPLKLKKAGVIEKRKLAIAVAANDEQTISELYLNYMFDATT